MGRGAGDAHDGGRQRQRHQTSSTPTGSVAHSQLMQQRSSRPAVALAGRGAAHREPGVRRHGAGDPAPAGVPSAWDHGERRRAARLRALCAAQLDHERAGPPDGRAASIQRSISACSRAAQARQSGLLVALEQYYRTEVPKREAAEQVTAGVYATELDLWRAWQDANDSASVSFVAFRPTADGGGLERLRRRPAEVLRRAQGGVRSRRPRGRERALRFRAS